MDRLCAPQNKRNLGANGNSRKAVELVESDWFVMMGADDVMGSGYLQAIASAIEPGVDIVQPGVDVIDEPGPTLLRHALR